MEVPKVKLNNGQEMPVIGLGTWRSYDDEAEQSVKYAIDIGYRHIDTAYVYENEIEVGKAIKSKILEGKVRRNELFVVTKLAAIHHEPNLVEHACRKSLKNLGLDYLDLYLIHFPVGSHYKNDETLHTKPSDTDYLETWKKMEKLVHIGLVKAIGVSNFNSEQVERIVKNCSIRPVTNQVECHPGFNQTKLKDFCKKYDIWLTAYCPLGRPNPENRSPTFMFNSITDKLAANYGKKPSQIILRYLIQNGVIPIPKSVRKERIQENFNVFDFELNRDDMKIMEQFDSEHRMIPFSGLREHKYFPFNNKF